MNSMQHKLFVDDIRKQYGSNEVLKGVSLKAKAGDVISIIGSSGSGKSTMLRCINFLEQPNQGRIFVDGSEVRTLKDKTGALKVADPKQLRQVRSKLSMVFQHFNLWSHMNVLENVTEAPVNVLGLSKKEAEDRAHLSGESRARAARGEAVSVASVERTAAARGDRAGAGDASRRDAVRRADLRARSRTRRRSAEVMQTLAEEGRTMIVVTHEMAFARNVSNHVVFLHQGRIEEEGHPDEVFGKTKSERLKQFLSGNLK